MTERFRIDSFALKIIAVLSMLVDHIGAILFPEWLIFRVIGRIAFPIFAYIIVEGFFYTTNLKKYMARIGIFALISEIPFDLSVRGVVLEFGHQNVFFTLFLGLLMLYCFVKASSGWEKFLTTMLCVLMADFLRTDYGGLGVLMILCFFLFRDRAGMKALSVSVINIVLMGALQMFGALAMIPISLHNRQQGRVMKWFFYFFYPVHLLILFIIKMIL